MHNKNMKRSILKLTKKSILKDHPLSLGIDDWFYNGQL